MSGRLRHYSSIAKNVVFGGCVATLAIGAYKGLEYIATKPKYNLDGLPLMETAYKTKSFSENKNPYVVITKSLEEEIKKGTEDEEKMIVGGLKYAVDQFNTLTTFYNYTLVAESDYFVEYGIEKNTSKNTIPLYIENIEKEKVLALTHFDVKRNGKITNAKIGFNETYLWNVWNEYSDERVYEGTNSCFTSIVQHELLHTIGFVDIYDEELKNTTIMYHSLNRKNKTYSEQDRNNCALLEERITAKEKSLDGQENIQCYNFEEEFEK